MDADESPSLRILLVSRETCRETEQAQLPSGTTKVSIWHSIHKKVTNKYPAFGIRSSIHGATRKPGQITAPLEPPTYSKIHTRSKSYSLELRSRSKKQHASTREHTPLLDDHVWFWNARQSLHSRPKARNCTFPSSGISSNPRFNNYIGCKSALIRNISKHKCSTDPVMYSNSQVNLLSR